VLNSSRFVTLMRGGAALLNTHAVAAFERRTMAATVLSASVEAFTLARAGAFLMIFSEDWIRFSEIRNGADGEQLMSLIADYTRAVAKAGGLRLGGHVTYGAPMDRKALALVARGATHLSYYQYGPVDLVTEAAFAGYGQDSLRYFGEIHDAQDLIAKSEPWLSAAARAPAHVALVAAQTDPIWHCDEPGGRGEVTTRDERGVYLALLHGHHPIDFVAEEDLASRGLDPYSVAYLNRQYVRDDAFAGLKRWVEAGGALQLGPGHATHNEYAQAARPTARAGSA
jgi:hypothetical protein